MYSSDQPYEQGSIRPDENGFIYGKSKMNPCPFCGETKYLSIHFDQYVADDGGKATVAYAWCTNYSEGAVKLGPFVGDTKREAVYKAIKGWNKRSEKC